MPSETIEIIINRQIPQNFYRGEMVGYTGRKDTGPAVLKLQYREYIEKTYHKKTVGKNKNVHVKKGEYIK